MSNVKALTQCLNFPIKFKTRIISKENQANNNGENNRLDLDLETEDYWGVIIQVLKRDGRQWVGRWWLLF